MIVIRKGFLSILLYDSFKDFIIMDRPNFAFTAFIFWLYSIYIYFMGSDPINYSDFRMSAPFEQIVHGFSRYVIISAVQGAYCSPFIFSLESLFFLNGV